MRRNVIQRREEAVGCTGQVHDIGLLHSESGSLSLALHFAVVSSALVLGHRWGLLTSRQDEINAIDTKLTLQLRVFCGHLASTPHQNRQFVLGRPDKRILCDFECASCSRLLGLLLDRVIICISCDVRGNLLDHGSETFKDDKVADNLTDLWHSKVLIVQDQSTLTALGSTLLSTHLLVVSHHVKDLYRLCQRFLPLVNGSRGKLNLCLANRVKERC